MCTAVTTPGIPLVFSGLVDCSGDDRLARLDWLAETLGSVCDRPQSYPAVEPKLENGR